MSTGHIEIVQEGDLRITRIHCKTGYIDRCVVDQAVDPNKSDRPSYRLNRQVSYFRADDGMWVSRDNLGSMPLLLRNNYTIYTSREILQMVIDRDVEGCNGVGCLIKESCLRFGVSPKLSIPLHTDGQSCDYFIDSKVLQVVSHKGDNVS